MFGFKKAGQVIRDGQKDIDEGRKRRPKDEVAAKRQQKNGGRK